MIGDEFYKVPLIENNKCIFNQQVEEVRYNIEDIDTDKYRSLPRITIFKINKITDDNYKVILVKSSTTCRDMLGFEESQAIELSKSCYDNSLITVYLPKDFFRVNQISSKPFTYDTMLARQVYLRKYIDEHVECNKPSKICNVCEIELAEINRNICSKCRYKKTTLLVKPENKCSKCNINIRTGTRNVCMKCYNSGRLLKIKCDYCNQEISKINMNRHKQIHKLTEHL